MEWVDNVQSSIRDYDLKMTEKWLGFIFYVLLKLPNKSRVWYERTSAIGIGILKIHYSGEGGVGGGEENTI